MCIRDRDPRGGARRRGRGDRPPQPRPPRHGDGPRLGPQDRALRRRQPGRPRRELRQRDRGPDPARGVRLPRRPGGPDRGGERHLPPGREPGAGVPAERRRRRPGRPGPPVAEAPAMVHAIRMPKPGQMTEECTITTWFKREGDPVARGDILFEIETDKSAMEVESFEDGVLLRRLVAEGDTVPVNTILSLIHISEPT